MNFSHIFASSLGFAVNKQELTIEINLFSPQISACRHGNFHDVTQSLVDWIRWEKFTVHFGCILSPRNEFNGLILNWNFIIYLQRLFRVVRLVAAWETRWWVVSIVEESRVLLNLSWFGWWHRLRAGASSLWNSRSDGYSWPKRGRLTELWHFSFDDGDKVRCLISLGRFQEIKEINCLQNEWMNLHENENVAKKFCGFRFQLEEDFFPFHFETFSKPLT